MKALIRFLCYAVAVPLSFVIGGAGSFAAMLWWDANIDHDHDGQAGIGFLIMAFFIGIACAIASVAVIAWREWKRDFQQQSISPKQQL